MVQVTSTVSVWPGSNFPSILPLAVDFRRTA
jgi:hypothetical protein